MHATLQNYLLIFTIILISKEAKCLLVKHVRQKHFAFQRHRWTGEMSDRMTWAAWRVVRPTANTALFHAHFSFSCFLLNTKERLYWPSSRRQPISLGRTSTTQRHLQSSRRLFFPISYLRFESKKVETTLHSSIFSSAAHDERGGGNTLITHRFVSNREADRNHWRLLNCSNLSLVVCFGSPTRRQLLFPPSSPLLTSALNFSLPRLSILRLSQTVSSINPIKTKHS